MHTVTKILVVFAAILAVLLAALTMAYSVNSSRIADDYRSATEREAQAKTLANSQVADAQLALSTSGVQLQATKNQVSELENQIRSLQAEKGQLQAAVAKAEGERDGNQGQTRLLTAANETQAALIKSYREEVTKLREEELASNRRRIELEDHINDLEGQLEVSVANVRALQEQLVEAQRTIQTTSAVRVGDTAAAGEPYVPNFAVKGQVTRVAKDVSGKDAATINLGSNNGIKENMQLSIFRGEKFIGHLVINRADLQVATGTVQYRGQSQQVQAGDEVKSMVASR